MSVVPLKTTTAKKTRTPSKPKTKPRTRKKEPSWFARFLTEFRFILYISVIFQVNVAIDMAVFLYITRSLNFGG